MRRTVKCVVNFLEFNYALHSANIQVPRNLSSFSLHWRLAAQRVPKVKFVGNYHILLTPIVELMNISNIRGDDIHTNHLLST